MKKTMTTTSTKTKQAQFKTRRRNDINKSHQLIAKGSTFIVIFHFAFFQLFPKGY